MATGLQAAGSQRGCRPSTAEVVRARFHVRLRSRVQTAAASANRSRDRVNANQATLRGGGYPSAAEANEATAAQTTAHSPSDSASTTISAARLVSGKVASCGDGSNGSGRSWKL